jgi:hypothetical protein
MTPHSQCPQCAAPLPPAAQKCQFCGATTAWGATLAQQQHQMSQAAAERDKAARAAKARSTAKSGLILAVVGLPICCGPLSLIGGVQGYRGVRQAQAVGAPRPVTGVIAMVLAVLSVISSTTVTVMFIRDQQKKADQIAAVQARLQGKRESLDQKVACDLVEEYLLQKGHAGKTLDLGPVNCDGALAVTDRRASAPDVRFSFGTSHLAATACLEKRSRWFVIKLLETGSCADLPPPAAFTPPPRQLAEDEIKADEEKARADLFKAASATIVRAFTDKLAKVQAHAAGAPGGEKVCAKGTLSRYLSGQDRREVPAVDFDLFDWKGGDDRGNAWTMMINYDVHKIMDPRREMEDRAKALESLRAESGPLLVVYKAGRVKLLPKVATGKEYDGGEYDGWLFVYDVDTADRLCQTRLTFESSDEVSFRKGRGTERKNFADAVRDDFEDRFHTAATNAIQRAAPDLKLGYKILE